jgi:pimeloyl-ACP methyl ester carboxylesterase
VAAYLAARWPARVRQLVITAFGVRSSALERALLGLAHGPAQLSTQLWQPWVNLCRPWLSQWQPYAANLLSAQPLPRLLASWYLDHLPADAGLLREGIADLTRMDLGAHLACIASIGDPSLIDALRSIRAPSLFVGGEHDRVAPPADLTCAAGLSPGSRTVVLARCGHVPMIEQPAAYHAALRSFLLGT